MPEAMKELINTLEKENLLETKRSIEGHKSRRRVTERLTTNSVLGNVLRKRYGDCVKASQLSDDKKSIELLPHGIQTADFTINLWPYSSFINRRFLREASSVPAKLMGFVKYKELERRMHALAGNPDNSMSHLLGLLMINDLLSTGEDWHITDGMRYDGVVSNKTDALASTVNRIILANIPPGRTFRPLDTRDVLADITGSLERDNFIIEALQKLNVKIFIHVTEYHFVIKVLNRYLTVNAEGFQGTIRSLTKKEPKPKKDSGTVVSASVSKKQLKLEDVPKTIYPIFKEMAVWSPDLKGYFIDDLAGMKTMFGKQLEALHEDLPYIDGKKPPFSPDVLMENVRDIISKLGVVANHNGFSCDFVNIEGLALADISPAQTAGGYNLFIPLDKNAPPYHDDMLGSGHAVIRRYLSGEYTVSTLFFVYILLTFGGDDFISNQRYLKKSVFDQVLEKSGFSTSSPLFTLVEKAKYHSLTNTAFNNYLNENKITIYDKDGGGYVVKKHNQMVSIRKDDIAGTHPQTESITNLIDSSRNGDYERQNPTSLGWEDINRDLTPTASDGMSLPTEAESMAGTLDEPIANETTLTTTMSATSDVIEEEIAKESKEHEFAKRAKKIAALFERHYEHQLTSSGLLKRVLARFAEEEGFEHYLADVGIFIDCDDEPEPNTYAYCFLSNDERFCVNFPFTGDLGLLYL